MKNKPVVSIVTAFVLAALTFTSVFAQGANTMRSGVFVPPNPGDFKLTDEALSAAAEVLGITADELSAALEEGTTLDELAETAGVDVQDVLDAIREAMPAPKDAPGQGGPGQDGSKDLKLTDDALEAAAAALGITVDELSAALEEGTTLEELAETAGVDIDDVMDAIREAMPAPSDTPGQDGSKDLKLTDDALEAAAAALGITVDELSAALEEGTTLEELAETAGVDVDDVMDAIHESMPAPTNESQNGQQTPGQDQPDQTPGGQPGQGPQGPQGPGGQPPSQ
jgi:uncharacterized protein YidB (DUF937 family)